MTAFSPSFPLTPPPHPLPESLSLLHLAHAVEGLPGPQGPARRGTDSEWWLLQPRGLVADQEHSVTL